MYLKLCVLQLESRVAMDSSKAELDIEDEKEEDLLNPSLASAIQDESPSMTYDPDAFDSMAVVNSEMWNEGEADEGGLCRNDLIPHGLAGLSKEELGDLFLKAAQSGVLEVIKELHELCGMEILQTTDEDYYTALHRASYNGHIEVAEYLVGAGAKLDARTIDGWQPLHCACRWNKAQVASLLLQNGAAVNAQTNGGQTALHLAASNDRAKATLELLLRRKGLDVGLRNGQNETALQVAQRSGMHAHLFEMVEESVDYQRFLK